MNDLDPSHAASLEDLARCLRQLYVQIGKPSFRVIENRTKHASGFLPGTRIERVPLRRSTLSEVLQAKTLPRKGFLLTFVETCGVDLEVDQRWGNAWDRIADQKPDQDRETTIEQLQAEIKELRQQLAATEHLASPTQAQAKTTDASPTSEAVMWPNLQESQRTITDPQGDTRTDGCGIGQAEVDGEAHQTSHAEVSSSSHDAMDLIRTINASNEAVEDQYRRIRDAADVVARRQHDAEQTAATAQTTAIAYQIIQDENPRRRAPLPWQAFIALVTIVLNGVTCYFAAQALGLSQVGTVVWTALLVTVLALGQVGLGVFGDRNPRAWRILIVIIGLVIATLGLLRFSFLTIAGHGGLGQAVVGSFLLAGATAGFLSLSYRALQAAETPRAWRARRRARAASRLARDSQVQAERAAADRDRLMEAYLGQVRRMESKDWPIEQRLRMESAIRQHLL